MKCLPTRPTSRFRLVASAIFVAGIVTATLPAPPAAAQEPILPPDSAAGPFLEGRSAVLAGRYREGIALLKRALATGHTKPQEHFGTSRRPVDFYDPHYWLGRALMEVGDDADAEAELRASLAAGVIRRHVEYSDLVQRLDELARRAEARRAAAAPTPLPTPLPTPVPTPLVVVRPTPLPPVPTVPPTPEPLVSSPPGTPTPSSARDVEGLRPVLARLSAGEWREAEAALARYRRDRPASAEADLLEAVALGSRYVLEGAREPGLLTRARDLLASYRRRGGSRRAEEIWISPSLRKLLDVR